MKKFKDMEMISFQIPKEMKTLLVKEAEREYTTTSSLLRKILKEYFERSDYGNNLQNNQCL